MGLTIHYSLQSEAANLVEVRQTVEQLRQASLDLAMARVGDVLEFSGAACSPRAAKDDSCAWLLTQARRMTAIGEGYHFVEPIQVVAFSSWPGDGCEVANFGLARYPNTIASAEGPLSTGLKGWSWWSFCKTQYATAPDAGGAANFVRCHLTVIRMLDCAKAMGILESVNDEGHFWENRDIKALVETVARWNSDVAAIVGQFKDQWPGKIISAPIAEFPNFERLEAEAGRKDRHDPHS
jgi:hypothetical protein